MSFLDLCWWSWELWAVCAIERRKRRADEVSTSINMSHRVV